MRVLVIGGSGFIGRNFLLAAPAQWDCVATYRKSNEFMDFLEENGLYNVQPAFLDANHEDITKAIATSVGPDFDVCLYAAGNSDIGLSTKSPALDLSENTRSIVNVLENFYIKKFIFISSGAVYEGYKGLVNPNLPVNPTIPYAISKLTSERYIEYFQKHTNHIDNYLCLRFFGAYGPMELERKIYTNLIKAFSIEKKGSYKVFGDGKNYIDAMYIDDMVEALMKMIKSDKSNKILDLCYGSPLTINELIYKVSKTLTGKEAVISYEGHTAEYTTFYASPKEVETLFGFVPSTSLESGMNKFSEYLCSKE